ncbi:MAG: PilZ domain-containing protein [bacterium]|nr:PilZ domain-containing protein [bacterium]
MDIKDVEIGQEIIVEARNQVDEIQFVTSVIRKEENHNIIYTSTIEHEGKILTFDTVEARVLVEVPGEKPILFRGAKIIPCKGENQQKIYRIKVDGIGIEYNRRSAFRCFLGHNTSLTLEDDSKQYRAILKDISSTGFGIVLTSDVLPPEKLEIGMKCNTTINDRIDRFNNVNIGLQGTVCRVTEVDGGKYVCGCELLLRSYEIDKYISLKERINLARKQMNANAGSRYEPKRKSQ